MRSFRKYHRTLAIILALPLFVTLLTGIAATLVGEWSANIGVPRSFLLSIHRGEIFGLQGIYPILNGLGLLGLLVTGLSMTSLFGRKKSKPKQD
ncbi:peptidase [Fischerella thermalis CCMEE 5205]|uniref:peptidase n=1 Tax=Fischerella thermalis TaxID=372787 RepID=UPI000C8050C5|nr:peptidase [Fischerella thermalis CCMEE 5205]